MFSSFPGSVRGCTAWNAPPYNWFVLAVRRGCTFVKRESRTLGSCQTRPANDRVLRYGNVRSRAVKRLKRNHSWMAPKPLVTAYGGNTGLKVVCVKALSASSTIGFQQFCILLRATFKFFSSRACSASRVRSRYSRVPRAFTGHMPQPGRSAIRRGRSMIPGATICATPSA